MSAARGMSIALWALVIIVGLIAIPGCAATTGAPGPYIPQPATERAQCAEQEDLPWCQNARQ